MQAEFRRLAKRGGALRLALPDQQDLWDLHVAGTPIFHDGRRDGLGPRPAGYDAKLHLRYRVGQFGADSGLRFIPAVRFVRASGNADRDGFPPV